MRCALKRLHILLPVHYPNLALNSTLIIRCRCSISSRIKFRVRTMASASTAGYPGAGDSTLSTTAAGSYNASLTPLEAQVLEEYAKVAANLNTVRQPRSNRNEIFFFELTGSRYRNSSLNSLMPPQPRY